MAKGLYIEGSRAARPHADRVIYCDGGGDSDFRQGIDLELSHWIPNRTPSSFKAGTSTEICLKFVEASDGDDYGLVVNNHVDVDGVLATFVLLFPELGSRHRQTLVQAAEMGDFWGWGEPPAQELFQSLACLMERRRSEEADPQEIYRECFELTRAVLSGARFAECRPGLDALAECTLRIERGLIARSSFGLHFVHYAVPSELAAHDLDAALQVPRFNAPLSPRMVLPPHARARLDGQRVQLVSVAAASGWYYDLWYPGYTWADTLAFWRPPGICSTGSSNEHQLHYPPLEAAVAELSRLETADGQWRVTSQLSPFATLAGRNFSVVLSFLKAGSSVPSALPPSIVAPRLAQAFESG